MMDKSPIQIPPDLLEKFGEPKDGFDFDATVKTVLSVKAEDVPDVTEFERRPKRKNGEGRAEEMKLHPKSEERGEPISLAHLTLEEALKKALQAKVEPTEPRKPGAGRKKKQTAE